MPGMCGNHSVARCHQLRSRPLNPHCITVHHIPARRQRFCFTSVATQVNRARHTLRDDTQWNEVLGSAGKPLTIIVSVLTNHEIERRDGATAAAVQKHRLDFPGPARYVASDKRRVGDQRAGQQYSLKYWRSCPEAIVIRGIESHLPYLDAAEHRALDALRAHDPARFAEQLRGWARAVVRIASPADSTLCARHGCNRLQACIASSHADFVSRNPPW